MTRTTLSEKVARRLERRWLAFLTFFLGLLGTSGLALAQEFQKLEGPPRQEVPAVPFVAIAYGIIWVSLLVYVLLVARGVGRVNRELAELERKLGGGSRP